MYAATATFYECLTGRPPFTGESAERMLYQHLAEPVPLDPVPEPLRPLVTAGMAKDPADRPADAAAFVSELRTVAAGAYGPDWQDRGRSGLAEAALLLAALWPAGAAPAVHGSTTGQLHLAQDPGRTRESRHLRHLRHEAHLSHLRHLRALIAAGAAAAAGAVVAVVVVTAGSSHPHSKAPAAVVVNAPCTSTALTAALNSQIDQPGGWEVLSFACQGGYSFASVNPVTGGMQAVAVLQQQGSAWKVLYSGEGLCLPPGQNQSMCHGYKQPMPIALLESLMRKAGYLH